MTGVEGWGYPSTVRRQMEERPGKDQDGLMHRTTPHHTTPHRSGCEGSDDPGAVARVVRSRWGAVLPHDGEPTTASSVRSVNEHPVKPPFGQF